MTTDASQEPLEEKIKELEAKLEKAEKDLKSAKSRAQETMREIWQIDVKLQQEEERANAAEAKLAEVLEGGDAAESTAVSADDSALQEAQQRISELETQLAELQQAQEADSEAEQRVAQLEGQVAELLDQRQAAADAEQRVAELEVQLAELQQVQETAAEAEQRVAELEAQLAEAQQAQQGDADAAHQAAVLEGQLANLQQEYEALRQEAQVKMDQLHSEAEATIANLHSQAEARIEELEQQLEEAATVAEEATQAQEAAESRGDEVAELSQQLEAAQRRITELEQQLAVSGDEEAHIEQLQALQSRIVELEDSELALHEAEERARIAEEKLGSLGDSAGKFEEQLREIQEKFRQAEERALDWEEKFHRSEERLAEAQAQSGGDSGVVKEQLSQLRERIDLANERNQLLQAKAEQQEERAALAEGQLNEFKNRAVRAESLVHEAQEKLRQAEIRARESAQASAGVDVRATEVEAAIHDARKRVREAEQRANETEVKLAKAIKKLKEYEQRANESDRETQRLAFQDSLTGLPNLNLIRQYLEFTVKQVTRYGRASALLVVDLDRFKLINDAMGFKAGDELLMRVSERLQGAIRESDALGRRGEDEFLILLSELFTGEANLPDQQKAEIIRRNIAIVVDRVTEGLARPFTIQGQKFYIRATIGVSVCPNDAETAQQMLEHADSAMYHGKESGRGKCVFYNTDLHRRQERRLAMDSQLRLAMEKGEFELYYQPILEVVKGKASMVGVEALLRWNHRLEGLLKPDTFLPAAEESGLIVHLGQWVCQQACWQLGQWLQQGLRIFVSVNVSTRQMLQADLAETILASVQQFNLPPELMFVEIAEGVNVEQVDLVENVVAQLGAAGIRIAIDDYGSGYSSLSRFDLNHTKILKIDDRLVRGCPKDKQSTHICTAAVSLAQSLGLRPLAEGVENAGQAKFFSKLGCQFMQGFYFQEPCTPDVITRLAAEKKTWKV